MSDKRYKLALRDKETEENPEVKKCQEPATPHVGICRH